MQNVATLLLFASTMSLITGEEKVPSCPTLSDAQITQLVEYTVKEDIHDTSAGDFIHVFGPKKMVDSDSKACVKYNKVRVNDEEFTSNISVKGEWFGGDKEFSGKTIKVKNGVYLFKKDGSDAPSAKGYTIYNNGNVNALFTCLLGPFTEEKKDYLKVYSIISVKKESFETPEKLKEDDQKSVEAAKKIIDGNKNLFGEIGQIKLPCV